MSISPKEWVQEEKRVEKVVQSVEQKINTLQQNLSSIKTDITEIRKSFWEDVCINVDEPHEINETFTSIKQQVEFLSERERSHGHGNNQVEKLLKLQYSPYFGRIDFRFEGEKKPESIYLGIATFLNEKDEILVYDWRAPISSLYYDSLPGDATYESPTGLVSGNLTLKRQFIIKNGNIEGMFDTGLAIGDELLQEVLGQQSDTQMKTIVSTIQKEQNSIIRNDYSKLLVVQGAAGSGKTSAALQRVAYLLYRYRETLQAEHIILFSPNKIFNKYVASVLPELGEKNMKQTTYHDFLQDTLGTQFVIEDPFTQLEYTLHFNHEDKYQRRLQGIQMKSTNSFLKILNHYISLLGNEGLVFRDIKLKGRTILSSDYMEGIYYSYDRAISIPNRLKMLTEHLLKEIKLIAKKEIKEQWVSEEIQYLDKETYLTAYENLQRKNKKQFSAESFDDSDLEEIFLSKLVVKKNIKPILKRVRNLRYIDMKAIYNGLFSNPACLTRIESFGIKRNEWEQISEITIESIKQGKLKFEDATPFLYLKERIEGIHNNTSVRHIFLDEAQDYSLIQLELLWILFPNSRFTLLGDMNQAIFAHSTQDSPFQSFSLKSGQSKEIVTLTKSYRSTRPIVEFTRALVVNGDQIVPFNRKGNRPIITKASDEVCLNQNVLAQIQSLNKSGILNIALICKSSAESLQVYHELKKHIPIRLIKKETTLFEPGLVIIPSYLAKGIEFDAVIIYNASNEVYGRESERKLFYTACTRAMHELYLNYIGEMNEFLLGVDPTLYVRNSEKPATL